jgi:hypothetical protein
VAVNPYRSAQFKALKSEWDRKLADSGFQDIESTHGSLKTQDRRTISWEHRELIADFFTALGHYLHNHAQIMQPHERMVLELYVTGARVKGRGGIAERVGLHYQTCFKIIRLTKVKIMQHYEP